MKNVEKFIIKAREYIEDDIRVLYFFNKNELSLEEFIEIEKRTFITSTEKRDPIFHVCNIGTYYDKNKTAILVSNN